MDASSIVYTGIYLSHIPLDPNTNLEDALIAIDAAFNAINPAPDYSGYNLYCVTQTDGISHPTNTQNFAEGISKILCDFKTANATWISTTYATDISTINTAITNLQSPALTYVPFSITALDTIGTVWSKVFTGLTAMTTYSSVTGATWAALSLPVPANVAAAFTEIIGYEQAQDLLIAGKQNAIANFDNSSNCLGGTNNDTIRQTVDLMRTYLCSLPSLTIGSITWKAVATGTNLQTTVQHIIDELSLTAQNAVVANTDASIILSAVGGIYDGQKAAVNPAWSGLFKVITSIGDIGNEDYLGAKIYSSDSSVTVDIVTDPTKVNLRVAAPNGKVKVNASDPSAGYLIDKLAANNTSSEGVSVNPVASTDNTQIELNVTVNRFAMANALLDEIMNDPDLLAKFCQIKEMCNGCTCEAPSNLVVTVTTIA